MPELRLKHNTHDFDDTFFRTSDQFNRRIEGTAEYLNRFLKLGQEQLRQKVLGSILAAKGRHAVHPGKILSDVTNDFNTEFPNLNKEVRSAMGILRTAWIDVPDLIPGTQEYLRFAKMEGLLLTASTNALPTWTARKVARINDNEVLIDPKNVYCVPVTRRKDMRDWVNVIRKGGYPVEQLAGFGDDITADIISMYLAGIRRLIRVHVGSENVNRGKVVPEHIQFESVMDHRESIEIVKTWLKET